MLSRNPQFTPSPTSVRTVTRGGFTYLGSVSIPPAPLPLILTDRSTGKLWAVAFNVASGPDTAGRISISDDLRIAIRDGSLQFPVGSEPVIFTDAKGEYRIFIRDSRIGIDFTAYGSGQTGASYQPTFARLFGSNSDVRQVYGKTTDKARMSFIFGEATR